MRPKLAESEQLTIEEYLDFTSGRPDGEKWELIEGVAIMQDSATDYHQAIAVNVSATLRSEKRRLGATWIPLLGVGTRVPISPRSLPEPDLMVKEHPLTGRSWTDDARVIFEIWSPSNRPTDKRWRLRVYTSVPNCQHYVTVDQDTLDVVRYDRATGWKPAPPLSALSDTLDLPALGCALPLSEIYLDTPLCLDR